MFPIHQRTDTPSSPEISSLFAKHFDGQNVDGFLCEEQDLRPTPEPQESHEWLPPALRPSYLRFLVIVSLILGIVVLYLTMKSLEDHGICDDNKSAIAFFSWRFLPTLVATVYARLVAILVNDVRRTEIFARLSSREGAPAAYTLCMPTRSWWNDPFDAWSRKKNSGKRSWALLSASVANLLALLVISPLSAIYLSPAETQFPTPTTFFTAREVGNTTNIPPASGMIMFRTTIAAVLNQTTSAWLSTEYTVVPFWPLDLPATPLGSIFSGLPPQTWSGQARVYQSELDCVPMSLSQTGNVTWRDDTDGTTDMPLYYSNLTFEAASEDGCSIVFSGVPGINKVLSNGGGWWAPSPYNNLSAALTTNNATLSICKNRSMLLVGTAFNMVTGQGMCYGGCSNGGPSFETKIQLCSTQYSSGWIDVNVVINQTSTTVGFDVEDYKRRRTPISHDIYNSTTMENTFFNAGWPERFGRNDGTLFNNGEEPWYGGPLAAIAAGPNYNTSAGKLYNSTSLQSDATGLLQQFFGESLMEGWKQDASEKSGRLGFGVAAVTTSRSRILSNKSIGIALGILLLVSTLLVLHVCYMTRLVRRPLGLYQDPGKIEAAAGLLLEDIYLREKLQKVDRLPQKDISVRLEGCVLGMTRGKLEILRHGNENVRDDRIPPNPLPPVGDPRPAVLRLRVGIPLLCFLLLLLGGLIMLYDLSLDAGLYQASLVHQVHIDIAQTSAMLAPYSIIPTFLAIGAKLWFAMAGDTVQRYQPFIAMVKKPTELYRSISVEFLNTPLTLVSLKALRSSHWLLALVGAAAFSSEVFTVSMSALWYRETRNIDRALNVTTPLILQTNPSTRNLIPNDGFYLLSPNQTRDLFISDLYDTSLQNWLYGATIEITQSAATPAWSKDSWSFLPRNLSDSDDIEKLLNSSARGRNITLPTTALKASLICHPQAYTANSSLWLTKIDFQNPALDKDTGNPLWNDTNSPSGLEYGYILKNTTATTQNLEWINCCANETSEGDGSAAVGYWANANTLELTSTWIDGYPIEGRYTPYYTENHNISTPLETNPKDPIVIDGPLKPELFLWKEPPRMAAISCEPRIEEADAMVTVDIKTGLVGDYKITSTMRNATGAWTYPYTQENLTRTNGFSDSDDSIEKYIRVNASWGYIFWDTLISSGLQDEYFRFQDQGLNVDLMSYSMLHLANNDQQVLLDPQTLMDTANQTFGIFFKHFACFNVSEKLGGYVYDKPTLDPRTNDWIGAYGGPVNATLSTTVAELRMSPTAAIMSMTILVFLIIVTLIVYTTNRKGYKAIPRDVDTLASTLGWVYASKKLLAWAAIAPQSEPYLFLGRPSFTMLHKARMGPFKDSDGNEHWGIELVDTDPTGSMSTGEGKHAKEESVSAGESIKLQTRKYIGTSDSRESKAQGIHERLLDASGAGSEAIVGAEEFPGDLEHDKGIGR